MINWIKAKSLVAKKWMEGYYCSCAETTYAFKEDYERHPVKTRHYIVLETMTDWGLPNRLRLIEIDPETICNCITVFGEEKLRLYEHDLISYGLDEDVEYEILWDGKDMRLCAKDMRTKVLLNLSDVLVLAEHAGGLRICGNTIDK